MNATRNLKATAAMNVLILKEVTIVGVQMDYNFYKTTRLVNARKVSRSRQTGQCVWVSSILFSLEVSVIK